ncbi:MAG: ABC transporter transmembrane domain-containing protein [Microthrixaceae bacterium]
MDLVQGTLGEDALLTQLAWLVLAGIAIYFLRVAWRLQLFAASYRLGAQLRERLYARLCQQGPHFFQQKRTGDLMALATNDIDSVEMASGEAMLAGFDGTLTLIMVVAMMSLGVDARLAAAALLPFPLMALAFWRISNHIHQASRDSLDAFGKLNDHVQETLTGVRTLRALGLEERSATRFSELAEAAASASLRAQRWEAAFEPAVGITLVSATALTLGLGGYLVWHDELTIGALTAFSMYLGQLIWPMFAAGWVLALLERGRAAWGRLQPTLDAPLSVDDHGTLTRRDCRARWCLTASRFPTRVRQARALCDLGLTVPAGQTLGLVGATGAGKSSVLRLILRQYAAQSGTITLGRESPARLPARFAEPCHQLGTAGAVSVFSVHCRQHCPGQSPMQRAPRSRRLPDWPPFTTTSCACRRATTRRWARKALPCRVASASVWPLRAPC